MSLTISLRVPDGIVLAADSLSTQMSVYQLFADFKFQCPECKADIPLEKIQLPPVPIPSSTGAFAQKITSLKTKEEGYSLGIATFGMGVITGKTVYYHLRMLNKNESFTDLTQAAERIADYFQGQLIEQFGDISDKPEDQFPIGFQIVGYENGAGMTKLIYIGKNIKITTFDKIGCTLGGAVFLVNKMWELKGQDPKLKIIYESLSLQDACDLAEYFIKTTAEFLRFANTTPNVGGDVDVALITGYSGFKWIKCKELTKILETEKEKL